MTKRFSEPTGLVHAIAGRELPDAGQGACCMGAAVYGPNGCTCWVRVHDLDQAPPDTSIAPTSRPTMCGDCAFRPDSPERTGAENAAHDADDLDILVQGDAQFWCHQGMRLVTAQRHPSGAVKEQPAGERLAYDPPIVDGVPYKADGTPGDLCAGQAAHRRAAARAAGRTP